MESGVRDGCGDVPMRLGTFDEGLAYWGGMYLRIQIAAEKWWSAKARRDDSTMAEWHPLVSHALNILYALTCGIAREGRKVHEDISALVDFMQMVQAAKAAWQHGRPTIVTVGKKNRFFLDPVCTLAAQQCASRIRAHLAIQASPGELIHAGRVSRQKEQSTKSQVPIPSGPSSGAVILRGPSRTALVRAKEKPLNDAQYAVVDALVRARPNGLTKDSLERIRTDARGILRRLRRDDDWAAVIHMAGITSGRYRIH